ncbi:AAA family ATPase [Photobacterium swingsii]|uniref:AAA family ATPase n=1 Tax=Photobacterium swingsii TaxID=680026 RepID=UPI00352C1904
MNFKINRLIIDNFKVFKHVEIDINGSTLTILDGPNGFGKTSFYDAIELLFTGTIKRYNDLETKAIDKRNQVYGCPFVYDKAEDNESLSIKVEIEVNDEVIFIERYALISKLNNCKGLSSAKFNLRKLAGLDSEIYYEEISNESEFIERLLGDNYIRNFHLFHYLEQEENTSLLKDKGKGKQEKIAHLFDVGDIKDNITKIDTIKKAISKLKSKEKKSELDNLKTDLNKLKEKSSPSNEKIEYKRLITTSDQPWDKEEIHFDTDTYANWLSDDGIINQVIVFISNISEYTSLLHNRNIKRDLQPSPEAIQALLKYGYHLKHLTNYKEDIKKYDQSKSYLDDNLVNIIKSISEVKLNLPPILIGLLDKNFDLQNYNKDKDELRGLITKSNDITTSVLNLKNIRDSYLEAFNQYHDHAEKDEKCPTCGFEWESKQKLLDEIKIQTELFNTLASDTDKALTSKLEVFDETYIRIIKSSLNQYIEDNNNNIEYKRALVNLEQEQLDYLELYLNKFTKRSIDISPFLCKTLDLGEDLKTIEFNNEITKLYKPTNKEKIFDYYENVYQSVFSGEINNIKHITKEDVEYKKKYIQQQLSQSIVLSINAKEIEYLEKHKKFENAKFIESKLVILLKIYRDSMSNYLRTISKDIEILFHIYSGRLLQSYQQGLGIFIENTGNSISFREKPNTEHDVIFSMSSGQLSALVISFTLALNKRYAKNNLLLIDDPVQTLDEINVSGFVDLLRNEFNDRKIFISTHEDNMSSYIRYKFKKMNLDTNRVNFRRKMLNPILIEQELNTDF